MSRTIAAVSVTTLVCLGFAACQSPSRDVGGDSREDGGSGAAPADDDDHAGAPPIGGSSQGGTRPDDRGGDAGTPNDNVAGMGGDVTTTAIEIAEPNLPSGKTYVAYEATISASGAAEYTWSVSDGVLPAGLKLDGTTSADVKISGTPTEAGQFPITLSVTDGSSTAELELTLKITHSVLFLSDRDVSGVSELFLSELGDSAAPEPVRLNASLPSGGGVSSYAWSPDGSRVLYVAKQSSSGNSELWVSLLATPGSAKRVSVAGTKVSQMAWLGSGSIAAYMTNTGDAYLVDLSGAAPGTSKLAVAASTSAYSLEPSPNGTSVTFTTQDTSTGEYATTYATWKSGSPKTTPLYAGNLPRPMLYSYDGLFGILPTMGDAQWWDLASSSPTAHAMDHYLDWSPNAHALLQVRMDDGGLLLNALDGNVTELVGSGPCSDPAPAWAYGAGWSPDGRNALIYCGKDLRAISDVTTATVDSDFSVLPSGFSSGASNPDLSIRFSTWSPDSSWLALRADRDVANEFDVQVIRWSKPGVAYKIQTESATSDIAGLAFSPNSQAIAFIASISPQANRGLYLTQLPKGGAPPLAELVSSPASAVVQSDLTWLPGTRVLAYRALVAGKAQLFALAVNADGTAGDVVSISGASGSGVSSYQLAPLQ